MKRLIMLGAGNVGGYLSYNMDLFGAYDVLGFLDDDPAKIGKESYGRRVLGKISDVANLEAEGLVVAICIASPRIRATVADSIKHLGFEFPNFIPSKAWLSEGVRIGQGNIFYPGVSINHETVIHDFVIMNMNCAIGHNCEIQSYATLAPGVNLAGFTSVGEGAELGIGVSTRQRVRIGSHAVVGGQAMVINDVSDFTRIAGVPGKKIN